MVLSDTKLSKTEIKKLDGINKNAEHIPAVLIGQIGKNSAVTDNAINLVCILEEVYAAIAEVRKLVGGRVIILECEDIPSLIQLYERHGFKLIETTEENVDEEKVRLRTMYIHVKS